MANEEVKDTQVSEVEETALSKGWKPEEEWAGDPGEWVDAGEFLRREPFFKQMKNMRREVRQLQSALHHQQELHTKTLQKQREDLIKQLKTEKKQAMSEGEFERVMEIDENLDELTTTPLPKPTVAPPIPPEMEVWLEQNPWYNDDAELRAIADVKGAELNKRGGYSYTELLNEVSKHVREKYLKKESKTPATSKVESGANTPRKTTSRKAKSLNDLPDSVRSIAKTLVRQGVMTEEEYLKDYFSVED